MAGLDSLKNVKTGIEARDKEYNDVINFANTIQKAQQLNYHPDYKNTKTENGAVEVKNDYGVTNLAIGALIENVTKLPSVNLEYTYCFGNQRDEDGELKMTKPEADNEGRVSRAEPIRFTDADGNITPSKYDLVEIKISPKAKNTGMEEQSIFIPAALLSNHNELFKQSVADKIPAFDEKDHRDMVEHYLKSEEGKKMVEARDAMDKDQVQAQLRRLETDILKSPMLSADKNLLAPGEVRVDIEKMKAAAAHLSPDAIDLKNAPSQIKEKLLPLVQEHLEQPVNPKHMSLAGHSQGADTSRHYDNGR